MRKIIFYYNRKYPEYDINKIPVNYEQFTINKYDKWLNGIYANYDICTMQTSKTEYFISLYSPYEDKDIYIHENTFNNELAFSYNKKLINEWRNEDISNTIHKLEERLKELKEKQNETTI